MQIQDFIDFFFPPQCAACEAIGTGLCERCFPVAAPVRVRVDSIGVRTLGPYEGPLKKAVLALKSGRRDIARSLADRLKPLIQPGSLIVPVPTTAARRRVRGFDGCELIARLATRSRADAVCGLRQISGDTQRGRRREERLEASGRFGWRAQPLCDREVVLLDDVLTTGATLRDCCNTILAAGGRVREAIVVAFVPG